MLTALIRSGHLDEKKQIPKAVEMAAAERLRKMLTCVKVCVIFLSILTFEPFYFPHGEQALSCTCASFRNMHCFSQAIICSLCFFSSCFLFLKFQFLWLKCLRFAFILDMDHQAVLPSYNVWLPWSHDFLFFFYANIHNSSLFNLLFLPPRFCSPFSPNHWA